MSSPDIRQLEKEILKRAKKERRPGPKPVRLSNLLAQTAWLGGELLWRDGRVVFQAGEKTVRIEEADIVRTSRALERLAARDLRRELADTIAERRQKFQYLRELATLDAPDLKTLCSLSRRQNPKAIARLGVLLVVESLVPELLDSSPTRALALAWPLSQPVLESLAKSEIYPEPTRELARFALANRHFEFWQKHTDFPVVLCVKLGFSGYGIPHQLEKSGPYSLSYNQIFELYQSGYPTEKLLGIVDEIRQIPSIWLDTNNLRLTAPFDAKEIGQVRAEYKSYSKASQEAIGELLFQLAKQDLQAVRSAAKFLIFWQWRWYSTFSNFSGGRKKRGTLEQIKGANEIFKTAFALLKPLANHEDANSIIEALLEKSRGFIGQTVSLDSHLKSLGKFRMFCTLARIIGVEKTRQLGPVNSAYLWSLHAYPEWLELAIEWLALCEGGSDFFWLLESAQKNGISLAQLKNFGREIEREVRRFQPEDRDQLLYNALHDNWNRSYGLLLTALYKKYSIEVVQFLKDNHYTWTEIFPEFARTVNQFKWSLETSLQVFDVVFKILKSRFDWSKPLLYSYGIARAVRHMTLLLDVENDHHFDYYRVALGEALTWSQGSSVSDFLWNMKHEDVLATGKRKNLRRALLSVARRNPRFTFEIASQIASLKRLHLMDALDIFETSAPFQGEKWYRFLARYPALEPELRDCFTWGKIAGEDLSAPPISKRWRDYETNTPREMEFLRAKILAQPQNLGLQKRLATLEEQWQSRDVWLQNELRECLLDAASISAKIAIQNSISLALRSRLRVVCGELPANLELDNDWINAILLACEVEENRKGAVTILKNCARVLTNPEHSDWREKLEANARFLEELKSQGKSFEVFCGRNEYQIGPYTLWIELEPLQILQMGNRFDTCLSRGGMNEHSAIANAIDANKKVVYARHFSSIVGRQLLCVSEKFELLGYHVYSTFKGDSQERYDLQMAFDEFASKFAEGVGIEKADEGKVAILCGDSWYDDGEIRWETLRELPPETDKRSNSRFLSSKTTRLSSETTQLNDKESSPIRQTRQNDSSDSRLGISTFAPT